MPVPETWSRREQRVLEAIYEIEEADGDRISTEQLGEMTGLPEREAQRALVALIDDGYVRVIQRMGGFTGFVATFPRLLGPGRRAVGQWPADSYEALLAILRERIEAETDPVERSKLEKLLTAVAGMGRDVLVDVLGAAIKHAGGLSA